MEEEGPSTPSPQPSVSPTPLVSGVGGDCGRGSGGLKSDEGTDTVVLWVYMYVLVLCVVAYSAEWIRPTLFTARVPV